MLYLQQRFGPVTSFSGSYRADRWELNINRTSGVCFQTKKKSFVLPNIDITSGCSYNNMTRSCPVPSAPENGEVNVTGVQPIVAQYSCHEGTLVGPEMRICLGNASWSGVEPSCTTGKYSYSILNPLLKQGGHFTHYSILCLATQLYHANLCALYI